jgi:hypothetical protein
MTLLFAVTTLLLAAAASAQDSTAPPDGWWDIVKDKVSAVVGGASDLCSNPYVSGPYLEKVFCDKIIPDAYTQKINNLTFGADTDWYVSSRDEKKKKKSIFFFFFSFFHRLGFRDTGAAVWRACIAPPVASIRRTALRPRSLPPPARRRSALRPLVSIRQSASW